MRLWPRSLFGRTAVTIALTMLLLLAISTSAAVYFVVIPMAKRSADDFAAEVLSAAHSLQSLPEERHAELQRELLHDHGLVVIPQTPVRTRESFDSPYLKYFHQSLTRLAGEDFPIVRAESGPLIWVDVTAHGRVFRLGFDSGRLGVNPPLAMLFAVGGGTFLTMMASLLMVRRVTTPLKKLSIAAQELGQGRVPAPISEDAPEEIAALTRAFNKMSLDIRDLSENRTVIVGGISHDLRTPLTRMELAVEMLAEESNPMLVAGIRRDLATMNNLIGQFLQFTRGIEECMPEDLDLWQVIESQAAELVREGAQLQLHRHDPPCVYSADPVALQRVLSNLLENAARYGGGAAIDVELHCNNEVISIDICDRGPGIPADQLEAVFRPFHRLEAARGSKTGGSGLGLAIAKLLADKNEWTIKLLPREGGGTVARLILPLSRRRKCA